MPWTTRLQWVKCGCEAFIRPPRSVPLKHFLGRHIEQYIDMTCRISCNNHLAVRFIGVDLVPRRGVVGSKQRDRDSVVVGCSTRGKGSVFSLRCTISRTKRLCQQNNGASSSLVLDTRPNYYPTYFQCNSEKNLDKNKATHHCMPHTSGCGISATLLWSRCLAIVCSHSCGNAKHVDRV